MSSAGSRTAIWPLMPNFHTSDENISMDQGIMSLDLF
jgi:hypothetical protein